MKRKVCGEFPEFCYRAYDCEKYAKQFINEGKLRLNCLGRCRNMESVSRCDPTEGFGHTFEPGIITVGWVSPDPKEKTIWVKKRGFQEHHPEYSNKIYCFCTCLPEVDITHMSEAFGKCIVKIDDPRKLAGDINEYFIDKGLKFIIAGCRVVYNKGHKLKKQLTDNERLDLAYKQKPERFVPDCEFRIVGIDLGNSCHAECKYLDGQFEQIEPECKFIDIDLGKRLDYIGLMKLS